MIEVFKYLNGCYNVQKPTLEVVGGREADLRGHPLRQQKNRYRLDLRGNYFTHRIVDTWNSLPEEVVLATTVDTFKSRFDIHWNEMPSLYEPACQE